MSTVVRTLLAASFVAILAGTASAAPAVRTSAPPTSTKAADPPIVLHYKYKAGQILHYRSVLAASGAVSAKTQGDEGPVSINADLAMTQTAADVKPDGFAELECRPDWLDVAINGVALSSRSDSARIAVMPNGDVYSAAIANQFGFKDIDLNASSFISVISALMSCAVPDRPVAVGESWRRHVEPHAGTTSLFRLLRIDRSASRDMANIGCKVIIKGNAPISDEALSGGGIKYAGVIHGRMLFDASNGYVVKQSATFDLTADYWPSPFANDTIPALSIRIHGTITTMKVDALPSMQERLLQSLLTAGHNTK
jgi:hypothetical protein